MICATCGQWQEPTRWFELHHPARRVNLSVTVPLCVTCHRWQTRFQRDAGMFRDQLDCDWHRVWQLLGFTGLLIAHAHAAGAEQIVADGGRQHRGMLRLLAACSQQPVGPNPIANTLRQNTRPVRPAEHASTERSIGSLVVILQALAAMLTELLPGEMELAADLTVNDAARLLRSLDARGISNAQAALEARPDADMPTATFDRANALTIALTERVAAAAQADALGEAVNMSELTRLARDLRTSIRPILKFMHALGEDRRP